MFQGEGEHVQKPCGRRKWDKYKALKKKKKKPVWLEHREQEGAWCRMRLEEEQGQAMQGLMSLGRRFPYPEGIGILW